MKSRMYQRPVAKFLRRKFTLGLIGLAFVIGCRSGCNGSAIVVPQDNERINIDGNGGTYSVHVLLNEKQHARLIEDPSLTLERTLLEAWVPSSSNWFGLGVAQPVFTGSAVDLTSNSTITSKSYQWRIETYIYPWMWYTEPGTWGATAKFRFSVEKEDGSLERIPGITVDYRECSRMLLEDDATHCPHTGEVRVRAASFYVPNATRGKADCEYGDEDCSRCVPDIVDQVVSLRKLNGIVMNVGDCCRSRKPHVQGIARLPDADITITTGDPKLGRIVSTNNITAQGFEWGYQGNPLSLAPRVPPVEEWWRVNENVRAADRDFDVSLDYNHPGGIQAHGNVVAIALESPKYGSGHAQVMFARTRTVQVTTGLVAGATRELWEIANLFTLNGSQGEPDQPNADGIVGAATVGFVKLASGYFLLAVAGADHGRDGIWFYESSSTTINEYTDWYFIEYWEPPCIGQEGGCYYGAGGGLNLQVGCDGNVYLLAMHGSEDRLAGDNDSVLQLFRVDQDAAGRIHLTKRAWWKRTFKSDIANNSFRWAGGSYVSRDGALVILDTRRRNGPLGGIGGAIAREFKDVEIQQYVDPSLAD